jgi:DNA-binding MarR family transcriptional regulator
MDVHQSTASNLVRALQARGYVQADKQGADRRAVQLKLLPAGRAALNKAPAPLSGVLPQALASLDAHTLARLDEDLARLIAVLDGDERDAKVPLGQ